MTVQLPPFPVDDSTLDLLSAALDPREHGDPEAEVSSVGPLLRMFGEMHGADYHDHDVIKALVAEVRRLRKPGRLLPEGGRERIEWGSRGAADPIKHLAEKSARYAVEAWAHTLLRRTIRSWPDGSSYTGPWVEVPAEGVSEGASA